MTRETVNKLVITNDVDKMISDGDISVLGKLEQAMKSPSIAISTGESTPSTESGGVILTPKNGLISGILTPQDEIPQPYIGEPTANALALGLRCPLCPGTRPPFSRPETLQQHLDSAAHDPKVFHCPLALTATMPSTSRTNETAPLKSFKTVSGLTAHVESGICQGGKASLLKVAEYIETRLKDMGIRVTLITESNRKMLEQAD